MAEYERDTPVILLTPEERQMLREAWKSAKDKLSLVALQNDDELRRLQDVSKEVKTVKRMKEEERQQRETLQAAIQRGVMQIVTGLGWVKK